VSVNFGLRQDANSVSCGGGRDVIAKRSHEPPHGVAKELIVLDDRDQ
jgi:hypothetical protein